MSFESVFEKWLTSKDTEEEEEAEVGTERLLTDSDPAVDVAVDEIMPELQTELWHKGTADSTPLLQKVEGLSAVQDSGKQLSSSLSPLHTSFSHKETHDDGRLCHNSLDSLPGKEKSNTVVAQDGDDIEKLRLNGIHVNEESNETVNCQQCPAQLPLTELASLAQLGHNASPIMPKGSDIDPVLSPEMELPMEPDSTSEVVTASLKYGEPNQKGDTSLREVSPRVVASPCRTGCGGDGLQCHRNRGMMAHAEESQAECDSTSLLLASPSAISPASQGEIEERVCPVLTDREDGASPAHCVCQCRALHPRPGLITREQTPVASTGSPHTVTSHHLTTGSDSGPSTRPSSKSKPPDHTDCVTTPDQEMLDPIPRSCVKVESAGESLQCEGKTPAIVFSKVHVSGNQSKTESVLRNRSPKVNKDSHIGTNSSSALLLPGEDEEAVRHLRHRVKSGPARLALSSQETSPKVSRKQAEVCDFARNIDWDSAVAETVESPSSMVECDGESKPGIILKIRTKAAVQCREPISHLRPPKRSVTLKRKGHSVDNSDMLSRLRKRQKPGEMQRSEDGDNSKQSVSQKCTETCQHTQKASTESSCSCSNNSVPRNTRRRRNTVQLGGDLKAYTEYLSSSDRMFVESATKLSRLQTQTYNLMCTLFPLLRLQLSTMTPESQQFTKVIDDIIRFLEQSDSEEAVQEWEDLCESLGKLTLGGDGAVPVFSPQVVLCSSPQHFLQEFQDKVCTLLQLLLPDVTVSFSDTLSQTSDQLEAVLKRIEAANEKAARKKLI